MVKIERFIKILVFVLYVLITFSSQSMADTVKHYNIYCPYSVNSSYDPSIELDITGLGNKKVVKVVLFTHQEKIVVKRFNVIEKGNIKLLQLFLEKIEGRKFINEIQLTSDDQQVHLFKNFGDITLEGVSNCKEGLIFAVYNSYVEDHIVISYKNIAKKPIKVSGLYLGPSFTDITMLQGEKWVVQCSQTLKPGEVITFKVKLSGNILKSFYRITPLVHFEYEGKKFVQFGDGISNFLM